MLGRAARLLASLLMLYVSWSAMVRAQSPQPAQASTSSFNTEQLDALLAPIALYPDALLTQILMATTFPLQVVEAARWADQPANKALSGDALTKALEAQPWDPSVKSLVPFPQVLALMNEHLDWMQQLGYAFADQQAAVMDSVQRLRLQAQQSGHLQSSPQQVVRTEQQSIIIEPAQPNVVYVPSYNPTMVYGAWPYPAYPPVYLPPPVAYPVGTALATGLAFGAGVAITAGLWNWARPVWGYGGGYVNVNVNRYNNINVNRGTINSNRWQANRPGGRPAGLQRPPGGPVGNAARPGGLPAGAIGRPQVSVPGNAVRPPTRPQPYAQRLISTARHQDGLYWPATEGSEESPLGPLVTQAQGEGYPGDISSGKQIPYQGYYFRILKAQGTSAPGGAMNYVKSGKMTDGFALIAWPASFGASGIMTFEVNQDGVVFQKDLGAATPEIVSKISTFDPDITWTRVQVTDN